MKVILCASVVILLKLHAIAQIQISNSKWKGQTEVPDIDLEFTKDTFMIIGQSGREFEVMLFSKHNDSLHLRKISGPSHPFNKYDYLGNRYSGGTSTAAPYVVGVAALLKSYFPQLSMLQIKQLIIRTVPQPTLMVYRPGSQTLMPFKSSSISGGILDGEAAVRKAIEITKQ